MVNVFYIVKILDLNKTHAQKLTQKVHNFLFLFLKIWLYQFPTVLNKHICVNQGLGIRQKSCNKHGMFFNQFLKFRAPKCWSKWATLKERRNILQIWLPTNTIVGLDMWKIGKHCLRASDIPPTTFWKWQANLHFYRHKLFVALKLRQWGHTKRSFHSYIFKILFVLKNYTST